MFSRLLSHITGRSVTTAMPEPSTNRGANVVCLETMAPRIAMPSGNARKLNLESMASTVAALYNLAPSLAQTSQRMDEHAREQASTVASVTQQTDDITKTLKAVIEQLETCSKEAFTSLRLIEEITDTSKILAINATIEAARAGDAGRPFGVVAEEMHRLAIQTEETSQHMARTLENMQKKVDDVIRVVGKTSGIKEKTTAKAASVIGITQSFREIHERTKEQQDESNQVHEMSEKTRKFSENLLMQIGQLRFSIHKRAESAVAQLMAEPAIQSSKAQELEPLLMEAIRQNPFFDLLYITDSHGRQITRNIGHDSENNRGGMDMVGKDWSQRPWFTNAMQSDGPFTSDLYLSVTTNRFCFTVSETILDDQGEILGVLGADIDFEKLLKH